MIDLPIWVAQEVFLLNKSRYELLRPGRFGVVAAADSRRDEFDSHNESLVYHKVPVDFVFIGDSITQMWDLQTYFGRQGVSVINRGIGGDETQFVLRRFPSDVLQLNPTYAVIKIGINDTWALDTWVQELRPSADSIREQVLGHIQKMVDLCKGNSVKPILCSILPTCLECNSNTDRRNRLVKELNTRIKEIAVNNSAIYIDYHSQMVKPDGLTLREELAFDGIHPDLDGYNLMAHVLERDLNKQGIFFGKKNAESD